MIDKQLKQQVRQTLENFPETRNSDALLIIRLYQEYYYLPDPVSQKKLLEIMAWAKPDDIVRIRRKFNQPKRRADGTFEQGRYLPTDKEVLRKRRLLIDKSRIELGYPSKANGQALAIHESELNKYQSSLL